jgi:hypothetical protein
VSDKENPKMREALVKKGLTGLLAGVAMLAGCDSSPSAPDQASLIGKWNILHTDFKLVNRVTPASSETLDDSIHIEKDVAGEGYFIRFSDGNTFTALIPPAIGAGKSAPKSAADGVEGAEVTGKWSVSESKLTTIIPEPSGEGWADTVVYTMETGPTTLSLLSAEVSEVTEEGVTYYSSTSITYTAKKE